MNTSDGKIYKDDKKKNGRKEKCEMKPIFYKDSDIIDIEKTVRKYKKCLPTTTQIRLLMSNSVVVKNKIEMEKIEGTNNLSNEIKNEIKYVLIKHVYQCAKEPTVKNFDKIFEISKKLKEIGSSKEKFDEYYRYLEEIVAYVKYYRG